jgi:hypothetical protein
LLPSVVASELEQVAADAPEAEAKGLGDALGMPLFVALPTPERD